MKNYVICLLIGFFGMFIFLVIKNSGEDEKTLIGTWSGTIINHNNTNTHYTIIIDKNGSCKIIEKENNNTYTYLGTWEEKFGYLGESKRYDWIQLDGATEELYEYTKQNTYKSSVYGELRGEAYKLKSTKKITLTMTPDGKIWGASLDAKRLANYPNEGTQLVKQNNSNTIEEPNVLINDTIVEEKEDKIKATETIISAEAKSIALWVHTFNENGYSTSYELELFDDNTAVYRPCYDDCYYVGKYGYKEDSIIFKGVFNTDSDYIEPDKRERIRVAFLRKDGKLINKGRVYIDTSKPTMYEVVKILTGYTFMGKKNNYYFTYNFTYNVLDENDNAMFMCQYEEFELNSNYGTTPMEILKQSANQATFLKSEKATRLVLSKDLSNNTIAIKKNKLTDIIPYFEFRISGIERDYEGNLINGRVDAEALGVALVINPK